MSTFNPARRPGPRRGFTLIEVLVVVGIVGLLVAILLPTLGQARRKSFDVVCRANLKGLGEGVKLYAAANRQFLPTYLDPDTADGNRVSSPQKSYRIAYTDEGDATLVTPANHGRLLAGDFVEGRDVYFCPLQSAPLWQADVYPDPFLSEGTLGENSLGQGTGSGDIYLVRSSYMYNPHVRSVDLGREFRTYERMTNMPATEVMFMDLLIGTDYSTIAHGNDDTWNAALADGSVHAITDGRVAEAKENFQNINWGTFDTFLAELQTKLPRGGRGGADVAD